MTNNPNQSRRRPTRSRQGSTALIAPDVDPENVPPVVEAMIKRQMPPPDDGDTVEIEMIRARMLRRHLDVLGKVDDGL